MKRQLAKDALYESGTLPIDSKMIDETFNSVLLRKSLILPYSYKPIEVNGEDSARETIYLHDGKIILVKDTHLGGNYHLGRVSVKMCGDEKDQQCYDFIRVTSNQQNTRAIRLHFHDLEGLMVGE